MEIDTDNLITMASYAIKLARAAGMDSCSINAELNQTFSTRFANSAIHQNFMDYETKFEITIIHGLKKARITINSLEEANISWAADQGIKMVKYIPDDPDFPGVLTEPQDYPKLQLSDPKAKNLTPSDVADKVISGINAGHEFSPQVQSVSGNLILKDGISFFVSSEGLEHLTPVTGISTTINIMAEKGLEESRSQSSFGGRRFSELPVENEATEVAQRAVMGLGAQEIEAKEYPVILDFSAVADQTFWLGYAFSAKRILDHESFLQDKMGEQLFSKSFGMMNDPHNSSFLAAKALDEEGVASQQYTLINQGVIENFAHTRMTASKMGAKSNGCGFVVLGELDPIPIAMKVVGGNKTRQQLIEELDKGLLVTNLHYSNFIDITRGTVTGMTKDGLFIVKNGEIIGAVKNMRFTDSLLQMFSQIEASKETHQVFPFWGQIINRTLITPAMRLGSMNFSSKTTH
ncbi:MAG: TldD/PmbA family protein [Candidatus Hodarchaeota archaeon]